MRIVLKQYRFFSFVQFAAAFVIGACLPASSFAQVFTAAPPPPPKFSKDAPAPKIPQPIVRWVDAQGQMKSSVKATGIAWTWATKSAESKIKTPVLRIWLKNELPKDWKPELVSAEGVVVVKALEQDSEEFILDLRSTRATLNYRFTDGKNNQFEMGMIVEVTVVKTFAFSTPECVKSDLSFKVQKNQAKHLYMGVSCFEYEDYIDIYFFRSEDSLWNTEKEIIKQDPQSKMTEFKIKLPKSKEQTIYTKTLLPDGTQDVFGGQTEFHVFYAPKLKPKRFTLSAGAGPTYAIYNERATSVKLTQLGMTGKVNAGYRLIPKLLDVAFNFFGTAFTVTHKANIANLSSARFYGLNGRIGYRLPTNLGATEFFFLTGWYFWGMLVNAPTQDLLYGIKQLNGPQLFFMMVNSEAGKRGYWGYFKLALISDQLKLNSINNREIAIGGGYQLSARELNPFAITLDIAHARFYNADNGMTLLSFSLGIQKAFFTK